MLMKSKPTARGPTRQHLLHQTRWSQLGRRENIQLKLSSLHRKRNLRTTHGSLTLGSSVVRRSDALEPLLSRSVPPVAQRNCWWAPSHQTDSVHRLRFTYNDQDLQLQAEGNSQHLEPLHLEIHTDRCLVVLVKSIFAKSEKIKVSSENPGNRRARCILL